MMDPAKKLLSSLAKVSLEIHNPRKDATAKGVGYKYVELDMLLDVIRPLCAKHGIVILQHVVGENLVTELWHVEGEGRVFEMPLKMGSLKGGSEAHQLGSAITYARKYSLFSLFAIHGEEDEDAAPCPKSSQTKTPASSPPAPIASAAISSEDFKVLDDPLFDDWVWERSTALGLVDDAFRKRAIGELPKAAEAFRKWKENRLKGESNA